VIDADDCDKIRQRELRCWRTKRASARVLVSTLWPFDANAAESARFDKALSDARTNCDGLLDGQRFERMAGRAEADWRGARKDGPPMLRLTWSRSRRPRSYLERCLRGLAVLVSGPFPPQPKVCVQMCDRAICHHSYLPPYSSSDVRWVPGLPRRRPSLS
jgi:hypothetical protein